MESIGIKNFRSFDEEGIFIENLKKINIFIGKNNSGKSNVLRFFQLLNLHIEDLSKFPNDITNQHRRNEKPMYLELRLDSSLFPIKSNIVTYLDTTLSSAFKSMQHTIIINLINFEFDLPSFFENLTARQIVPFQTQYSSGDIRFLLGVVKENWKTIIKNYIKENFKDLIYIPHLRVIKEGHKFGESNSAIDGSNIISKIFEMQNPEIGKEFLRDKFILIQSFVRNLINNPGLLIEIPHTKKEIILTIDGVRMPLDSFGTGIHQLVMLCSTLVIHENSVVCIEEPEIHLHPELQRKFIDFLGKTKNKYFITTHSNIFLNSRDNTSIYHVQNDGVKSSIFHADQNSKTFKILNDLGYKSSDILHSNGIIWVEGPSDRNFLLGWIRLLNPSYIEGIHFSIMFYGGRLLSHLTFENDQIITELIPLLKLNKNAFVIMDRDGFSSRVKINETKRRIENELGTNHSWITKGREMENYISQNTLNKWLSIPNIIINPDEKLEESISKVSQIKYAVAKSKFSFEISKYFSIDEMEVLDLKQKLRILINLIENWNS